MTKEQILQSYLEDELFVEKRYLNEGDATTFKWTDPRDNTLIKVLRLAIEGIVSNESDGVTSKKINSLLNRQS
jgi:hypothetical protein